MFRVYLTPNPASDSQHCPACQIGGDSSCSPPSIGGGGPARPLTPSATRTYPSSTARAVRSWWLRWLPEAGVEREGQRRRNYYRG